MISFSKSAAPIGVDIGSHGVKLVQLGADGSKLREAARWDLPSSKEEQPTTETIVDALKQARVGKNFSGRKAVLCLGRRELFLQNVRVPAATGEEMDRLVHKESAGRLPFSVADCEIRYLEAGDVRQGDTTLREVIVFACHRPKLEAMLHVAEAAGLEPVAVDVEVGAMARAYWAQFRRDEDNHCRAMFVHVGYHTTAVTILHGDNPLFMNYLDWGGANLDQAVAQLLKMQPGEAAALRRHNGDRRADQQDPAISEGIAEATRPVLEELISELSRCIRYHSVTFRGQPLTRLVLGGGESQTRMLDTLAGRFDLKCELWQPPRHLQLATLGTQVGQWDVAMGLALREVNSR